MNSAEPSSPSAGNSGQDRRRMAELLERLATREGATSTPLPGVRIFRDTRVRPRSPVVYSPRIVIVAQGRKRGYLGEVAYTYDPDNYLVLSVPLPFECEIAQASAAEPFLALAVDVDVAVLGELVLELGETAPAPPVRVGVSSCPLTPELRQAAVRLLECLLSPDDSRILGPQVVREIVYRVLRGEQGPALRALTGPHNGFAQIARALRRIHTEYPEPLDVETLARTANMSVSVFHQHFKTITATSPIQYLKSIRLHKARMLMTQDGMNAKAAAGMVGYASPSQFSREFKRFFGASPARETARLRDSGLAN